MVELAENETQVDVFSFVEMIDDNTSCIAIIRNAPKNYKGDLQVYEQHMHTAIANGGQLTAQQIVNNTPILTTSTPLNLERHIPKFKERHVCDHHEGFNCTDTETVQIKEIKT